MTRAQARFHRSVQRTAAASFFTGTVVVIMGSDRFEVKNCVLNSGTNAAELQEFDVKQVRTLDVEIPKSALPRKPNQNLDGIEYNGIKYTLTNVEGEDDVAPDWSVSATADLQAS